MNVSEKTKIEQFYPDIITYGGLTNAINENFNNLKSTLKTIDCDNEFNTFSWAIIKKNKRSSQVTIALNERLFIVSLWNEGINYGAWNFVDLKKVSQFIVHFVELKLSIKEIKKTFPWFESKSGELHEKGVKMEIKYSWNNLIKWLNEEKSLMKYLLPCVKITKKIPQLRVLFPFTSMNTLCFSLTTGYPYKEIGPKITAWENNCFEIKFCENEIKKVYSLKDLKKHIRQEIGYYGIAEQGTVE